VSRTGFEGLSTKGNFCHKRKLVQARYHKPSINEPSALVSEPELTYKTGTKNGTTCTKRLFAWGAIHSCNCTP
jgi:hypothetical protein